MLLLLLSKGPVTLCNFLSNLSRNTVARQVAGELHSVTWVVWQFFFVARSVARSITSQRIQQQLATPLHSVSSSNLSRNFTAVLTRAHAHTSCFSFRGALRDKLLRKLHSVTVPQHQTSATCNATFSTIARQVAEKIAQCNRALSLHILMQIHNNISLYFLENISNILPCTHSA